MDWADWVLSTKTLDAAGHFSSKGEGFDLERLHLGARG
jgi:hypothetical protein